MFQHGPEVGVEMKLPSPAARFAGNPMLSGQRGGHSIDLRQFARDGIRLYGRLESADGTTVRFSDDLLRAPEVHRLYMIEVTSWWLIDTTTWADDRIDRRTRMPLADLATS